MSKTNMELMTMFVGTVLRYGSSTTIGIVARLNNRGSIGWRNFVTRDFTETDVVSALEVLSTRGFVASDGTKACNVVPVAVGQVTDFQESSGQLFRLTREGRDEVEKWEPPKSLEDLLIERVQESPSSFHSLYRWLRDQIDEELPFAEFVQLVDEMLDQDYLHLLQTTSHETMRVPRVPEVMWEHQADIEHNKEAHLTSNYILTLGPMASSPLEVPIQLAETPDPQLLLEKIQHLYPDLRNWFGKHVTRHIMIDEENIVTVGVDTRLDSVAQYRYDRGLPGLEELVVRDILLDPDGIVIADYHGPILEDPLVQ
jgi:hypothetical protein